MDSIERILKAPEFKPRPGSPRPLLDPFTGLVNLVAPEAKYDPSYACPVCRDTGIAHVKDQHGGRWGYACHCLAGNHFPQLDRLTKLFYDRRLKQLLGGT